MDSAADGKTKISKMGAAASAIAEDLRKIETKQPRCDAPMMLHNNMCPRYASEPAA